MTVADVTVGEPKPVKLGTIAVGVVGTHAGRPEGKSLSFGMGAQQGMEKSGRQCEKDRMLSLCEDERRRGAPGFCAGLCLRLLR